MKPWYMTIQMKAIKQYFHVVLFTALLFPVLECSRERNKITLKSSLVDLPIKEKEEECRWKIHR